MKDYYPKHMIEYDEIVLLHLINITEADHQQMMFDYGCAWVERHYPSFAAQKMLLMDSKLRFWQWWAKQWQIRNHCFYDRLVNGNISFLSLSCVSQKPFAVELLTRFPNKDFYTVWIRAHEIERLNIVFKAPSKEKVCPLQIII